MSENQNQDEKDAMGDNNIEYHFDDKNVQAELSRLDHEPDHTSTLKVAEPLAINKPPVFKKPLKEKLHAWLRSWRFWVSLIFILLAVVSALWFIPPTRAVLLNTLGFRTTLRVVAIESQTSTPTAVTEVKNFVANVNGEPFSSAGKADLTLVNQTYGKKTVVVTKAGYEIGRFETILDADPFFGVFGPNQGLIDSRKVVVKLKATGIAVNFIAKDWLSGTPLANGWFTLGDQTAMSDKDGKVGLVVPPTDDKKIAIKATFGGTYIDKSIDLDLVIAKPQTFTFVPAGKHYFVSKKSGVYSVYGSNVDSSELQEVIAGTAQETSSLIFAVNPSGKYAVMASTREGTRDSKGRLLQKLYLFDLQTKKMDVIDQGVYFTFYDWSGDALVYAVAKQEEKATDMSHALRSVDTATKNQYNLELEKAFIGPVYVALGSVVYQYNNSLSGPNTAPVAAATTVKGANKKDLASNVKGLVQLQFDQFAYSVDGKHYAYNLNTNQTKDGTPPSDSDGVKYLSMPSPNGKYQLMVNKVDGKNALFIKQGGEPQKLFTTTGISGPVHWLGNDVLVFRVVAGANAADYAISLRGGEPKKVNDAVVTTAIDGAGQDFFRFY